MGLLGKVLAGAAIGVGAVALAPFTGGGSVAAGVTLAASLSGPVAVSAAVGAGATGMAVGKFAQDKEDAENYDIIKNAKKSAFKDGINEGITLTKEELIIRDDYMIAITAFVYYIARVDGVISEEEEAELNEDLVFIRENADLPDALVAKLYGISKDASLTFEQVTQYLDRVSIKNLESFIKNLDEIIEADNHLDIRELEAKEKFMTYYQGRLHE